MGQLGDRQKGVIVSQITRVFERQQRGRGSPSYHISLQLSFTDRNRALAVARHLDAIKSAAVEHRQTFSDRLCSLFVAATGAATLLEDRDA